MATVLQDASVGSALDTIQTVNSATSVSGSAWGSTIQTTFTATNQTLTLPTIAVSDIGKSITVQNAGTNSFSLAIASGAITTNVGLVVNPGNSFILKAVSTTSAVVVSPVVAQNLSPEFGTALYTISNNAFPANSVIMSFTLPSAGVWDVQAQVATNYNLLGSGHLYFRNSALTEIPNSRAYLQGGSQGSMSILTHLKAQITTVGAETIQLFTDTAIAAVYGYDVPIPAQGGTKVVWKKISGQVPVTGQSVQRSTAALTALANATPAANTWTDINPITFTVPANIDVDLSYQLGFFKSTTGVVNFRMFDVTGNTALAGSLGTSQHDTANFEGNTVRVTVQVSAQTVAKTYKVQFQTNTGGAVSLSSVTSANISYTQAGSSSLITQPKSVSIVTNGSLSITNGTPTVLPSGTIVRNTTNSISGGGAFSWTAPRDGDYKIDCKMLVSLNGDTNWVWNLEMLINGVVSAPDAVFLTGSVTSGSPAASPSLSLNTTVPLSAGNVITFRTNSINFSATRLASWGRISIVEI